jgi:ABC-2 type transport system ATP-binding protein
METILKTSKLSKYYYTKCALRDVDIEIPKGRIVGLLGPNGSGKTTFIKIAAGILRKSSGEITICNKAPGPDTKAIVSYLPDVNHLYNWMKISDSMNFFSDFYKDFDKEKFKELMKFMKLNEDDKITSLSKGMTEKLLLSLVLSRKAKLYILDEPLAGVDPVAREKILDTIINNYNEESSMIITTHLVNDIERIFDDVLFMKDGEIVLSGNAEELRTKKNKSIDELFREVYE